MCILVLRCRLAVTKLDILDDMDEVKIGVGYSLNGQKLDTFPG
jgi:adenylosuccinate synthase